MGLGAALAATDLAAAVASFDVYYLDWRGHLAAVLIGGLGAAFGLIRRRHEAETFERKWIDNVGDWGVCVLFGWFIFLICGYKDVRILLAFVFVGAGSHFLNRKTFSKGDRAVERVVGSNWRAWLAKLIHPDEGEGGPPQGKP